MSSSSTAATAPVPLSPEPGAGASRLEFLTLWRNVTFLLALATFSALLITRELDPVTTVLFPAALLTAWLLKRPPAAWRAWMGMLVTLGVLVLLARLASQEYFRSLLRLLLFLVIFKCFSLKSSRDYLQVQILCFFILVASAVITVTFLFSIVFPIYLVLAVLALVLYSIGRRREAIEPARVKRVPAASPLPRLGSLPAGFLAWVFGASLSVMVLVVLFFFFIPHYSLQKLDAPLAPRRTEPNQTAVTGFGEDVRLGDLKQIVPDGTVVMRVELRQEGKQELVPPNFLRLRGVVLDIYENNRWRRNTRGRRNTISSLVKQIQIEPKSVQPGRLLLQRVYQNPDMTLRLFGTSFPVGIRFENPNWVRRDVRVSTYQATAPGQAGQEGFTDPFVYEVISNVTPEATDFLSEYVRWEQDNPGALMDRRYRLTRFDGFVNTQLPQDQLSAEIRGLSLRVAPGPSQAQKISQVLEYLRRDFSYTLEPDTPDGTDPIRAFLFQTRKGHCEFFATSLVLMLRAQGIPARIVNGFYTTDWNNAARVFLVKQSDAHSWAEVWLDGVGWLTVDPTPPSSAGSGAYPTLASSPAEPLWEYLRIQWQRRVIDYSAPKQAALYRRVGETYVFRIFETAGSTALDRISRWSGGRLQTDVGGPALSIAVAVAITAVFLGFAFRLLSLLMRRVRPRKESDPPTIDYFNELIRKLEKLGVVREPSQTPRELVREAAGRVAPSDRLDWVVDLYYAERFSGLRAAPEERRSALRIIEALTRLPPRGRA